MHFIDRKLMPIYAMLAFMSSYIGSAHAQQQYYYFQDLTGLVESSKCALAAVDPFCPTGNTPIVSGVKINASDLVMDFS